MIEKDLVFDKRILQRNLEKGLITREEYEKHIAGLSGLEGNFTSQEIGIHDGEFDLDARELTELELLEQKDELDG